MFLQFEQLIVIIWDSRWPQMMTAKNLFKNQDSFLQQMKFVKLTRKYPNQKISRKKFKMTIFQNINKHYAARANKSYNCRHNSKASHSSEVEGHEWSPRQASYKPNKSHHKQKSPPIGFLAIEIEVSFLHSAVREMDQPITRTKIIPIVRE